MPGHTIGRIGSRIGTNAARRLVRSGRTSAHIERACLERCDIGKLVILIDNDPGNFNVVGEHTVVRAWHEDVFDLAQCAARCLRNAHVCHVATTGRSEQVIGGIEPERVDIGVFVIVREFARSPHAAIADQTRANQIDLIACNDARKCRAAFQHAGDHRPRAAVSAGVLLVEASIVNHIPGGDVDLLEARIALESFVEEVGVRHIQATTVEIEQAREAGKPVAEVAHLDAIGTIAYAAIFASFTEVGLDVLDLDDRYRKCARCREPRQLRTVFGNQMVCRSGIVVETHGKRVVVAIVLPPSVRVLEFSTVVPVVGMNARSVMRILAEVGVRERLRGAVAVLAGVFVDVPETDLLAIKGGNLGKTRALQNHVGVQGEGHQAQAASEHTGERGITRAHVPSGKVELFKNGAAFEHRLERGHVRNIPVGNALHFFEARCIVERTVEACHVAGVQVGAVEAYEVLGRALEPLCHGVRSNRAVGGISLEELSRAPNVVRLDLPRHVRRNVSGMRCCIAHQTDADHASLLGEVRIGHGGGIFLRIGPPDVRVVFERATTVGRIPGVGGNERRRRGGIALHQIDGVTDGGREANRVGILDPYAIGSAHERCIIDACIVGIGDPQTVVGAEDVGNEIGLARATLGNGQHIIERDGAVCTHVPLRQIDSGDLQGIACTQVVEHLREVVHLAHIPVSCTRVRAGARDRFDARECDTIAEGAFHRNGSDRSVATRVPVAQTFDVGELGHTLERIGEGLQLSGAPCCEIVERFHSG